MNNFIASLIPRWRIDTVALRETEFSYEIVCILDDVEPGEVFDAICDFRVFTWLNWSWPRSAPLNIRPFTTKAAA